MEDQLIKAEIGLEKKREKNVNLEVVQNSYDLLLPNKPTIISACIQVAQYTESRRPKIFQF